MNVTGNSLSPAHASFSIETQAVTCITHKSSAEILFYFTLSLRHKRLYVLVYGDFASFHQIHLFVRDELRCKDTKNGK